MPIEQDEVIRSILTESKVIAVVGASPKPYRDANSIARFLERTGYTVYRVNPLYDTIDGKPCYKDLASVPEPIDLVDVFRRSDAVPDIVEEAIAVKAKAIWLQFGVIHEEAAAVAEAAGMQVIMDHCIAVDHRRLVT